MGNIEYNANICKQIEEAHATCDDLSDVEDQLDPAMQIKEGETTASKLEKLIVGKQYKPELPLGHHLTTREAKCIRFNKAKIASSKKGDELELPHSTPL